MVQQSPDNRPNSIEAIKNLLIASGNELISRQKLDHLQQTAVPAATVTDPFVASPLKRIGVDIRGNTIVAVLNDEPRPDWVRIFARQSVRAFVAGAEPANWKFNRREAAVDLQPQRLEGEARSVLAHFDSYVENANALFREHLENVERLRQESFDRILREGVEEEQRRQRILSSLGT
jgi:hypothetical protein